MFTEMYEQYIRSGCEKIAEKIAPDITSALAFDGVESVTPHIEKVVSIFAECLKEEMLKDMRKCGWQV